MRLLDFIYLFPFDILKSTKVLSNYRTFKNQFSWKKDNVEQYQLKKLKLLLEYAYVNNEYYRGVFKMLNLTPNDFKSIKDLEKLPILTRNDLIQNRETLISKGYDKKALKKGSSSGSTGSPVVYYHSQKSSSAGKGAHYTGWSLSPWKFGMKGLHIWGNPNTVKNEWQKPFSRLKAKFWRQHKFPAYTLSEKGKFQELYDICLKEKYTYVDGYTNAIYLFSNYLFENNLSLPSIQFVLPTGENLQDFQKQKIEKTLGPVYDTYGCSEINGIAHVCKYCGNYHIIDPHVIVEYGQSIDRTSNEKPLIITDLDNYAFPLIRYENGDFGVSSFDKCKIPFNSMKSVSGRVSDIVKLPNGGVLSVPSFFGSMLLKKVSGIKQYQIVRDKPDHLIIKIVKDSSFSEKNHDVLSNAIHEYLNNSIKWDIEYPNKIEISENGKFKLLVDLTK